MALAELLENAVAETRSKDILGLIVSLCQAVGETELQNVKDTKRFCRIIEVLLGFADEETRAKAARQIIKLPNIPSEVHLFFACDMIDIARPFLDPDFELSRSDLVHIAKFGTREHRRLLLKHPILNARIVREIMRHGEVDIIRELNEREEDAIFFEYDDDLSTGEDDGDGSTEEKLVDEGRANAIDIMLTNFAEKSQYTDIVEVLAKQAQIPKQAVRDLFSANDAEPFGHLCKGLSVGQETFKIVARFRCRRLGQLERLAEQATAAYEGIQFDDAAKFVRQLQISAGRG